MDPAAVGRLPCEAQISADMLFLGPKGSAFNAVEGLEDPSFDCDRGHRYEEQTLGLGSFVHLRTSCDHTVIHPLPPVNSTLHFFSPSPFRSVTWVVVVVVTSGIPRFQIDLPKHSMGLAYLHTLTPKSTPM